MGIDGGHLYPCSVSVCIGHARADVTDIPAIEGSRELLPYRSAFFIRIEGHIHGHATSGYHDVTAPCELPGDVVALLCAVGVVCTADEGNDPGDRAQTERSTHDPYFCVEDRTSTGPHLEPLVLDVLLVGIGITLQYGYVLRTDLLAPPAAHTYLIRRRERLKVALYSLLHRSSDFYVRWTDESACIALGTGLDILLELLLGEEDIRLSLSTLWLDGYGGSDANLAGLDRIQDYDARHPVIDKIVHDLVRGIVRPVLQAEKDLIVRGDHRDLYCRAFLEDIAVHALLIHHDAVHDTCPDHLAPPSHGSGHLGLRAYVLLDRRVTKSRSDPGVVYGGTAYATDIHLVPEVVILSVEYRLCGTGHVVAIGDEDGLALVQSTHANLDEGCIGVATRHVVGDDLDHIGYFFAQGVQHAGVKSLGIEVLVAGFLPDMAACQKLSHLLLYVAEDRPEVLYGLRLDTADGPRQGCIHQDLGSHIEGHVPEPLQTPVVQVPAVRTVSAAAYQDSQQHNLSLSGLHSDAACTALIACQVARPIGTERASVTYGVVIYPVSVGQLKIPVPELCYVGIWGRPHRLIPFILFLNDSSYVDLDVLHVLNSKAALHFAHVALDLLFL